jgi:hypothetical protein
MAYLMALSLSGNVQCRIEQTENKEVQMIVGNTGHNGLTEENPPGGMRSITRNLPG